MTSFSTVAAFRKALVTAFKAHAEESVQVSYARPSETRSECFYLGDSTEGEDEPTALKTGTSRRQEKYDIDCLIEVVRSSAEVAEARACELGAIVESVIADKLVEAEGVLFAVISSFRLGTSNLEAGDVLTELRMTVSVTARKL